MPRVMGSIVGYRLRPALCRGFRSKWVNLMTSRIVAVAGLLFVFSVGASCALAEDFATQSAALEVITKAATEICYTVSQEGSRSNIELSGEARAQLDTAISKVVDLGIKGAAQYKSEKYNGVIQAELATIMKSSMDCKLDVFNKLVNKILGWRPPASQNIINTIADYIIEGEQISTTFIKTNNNNLFLGQYKQWSSMVEKYLEQTLDRAYVAQFRSAQPVGGFAEGMNIYVGGILHKLNGQNTVLSQIITELRRS